MRRIHRCRTPGTHIPLPEALIDKKKENINRPTHREKEKKEKAKGLLY